MLNRRTCVVLAALLLAVSCTPDPGPAEPVERSPRWTALGRVWSSADSGLSSYGAAAGWDGGVALLTGTDPPTVLVSSDGRAWTVAELEGLAGVVSGTGVAGHGSTVHVLGTTADGAAVWHSRDGRDWSATPVPDTGGDQHLGIAAGPRGVVVAGTRPAGVLGAGAGLRVWYSPDGVSFDKTVRTPSADVFEGMAPQVVATADGFLLLPSPASGTPAVHSSTDGLHWQDIGAGLSEDSSGAAARSGSTTVVFADDLTVRYRRDDDPVWRSGVVDVGHLPDAGVAPREYQQVVSVRPWHDGFLALGVTHQEPTTAATWTSPDGATWTRAPVRDNHFDDVDRFVAAVTTTTATFLLGVEGGFGSSELHVWTDPTTHPAQTAAPVVTTTTAHAGEPTEVVDVRPWDGDRIASGFTATGTTTGSCWTSSLVSGRADSWRCATDAAEIEDPCFAGRAGTAVACVRSPAELEVIQLAEPLPAEPGTGTGPDHWMLELDGGAVCRAHSGSRPPPLDGQDLVMSCADGTFVWGAPDTSASRWTVLTSPDEHGPAVDTGVVRAYR
ncbi:hypothetical protein [Umezawaea beigongshangensis]|uniref:hypothetical protein n=1 Tax=Umezawaea beigongshangensis TaxID=2780383 RepID=UPI0018F129BD|nr:hypothetical protein [Umezawaea beigongshangensis]